MNRVFFILIVLALGLAGWHQLQDGGTFALQNLSSGILKSADDAVRLGISLIGSMAFFLGVMKICEEAGAMAKIAVFLRPLLQRLFPEISPDHPAMGAMIMNVAANVMGLSNAATPFGIRAMRLLNGENPQKGVASNAMILFMSINISNVTLLPSHVLALRLASGSQHPATVIATTLFSTIIATIFAVFMAKSGQNWFPISSPSGHVYSKPEPLGKVYGLLTAILAFMAVMLIWGERISPWIIPCLLMGVLIYGLVKNVPLYEAFVRGAREGIRISIRIMPYLIAIMILVGMVTESGVMASLITPLGRITSPLGLPPEALTMGILRSLSGSASFGYLASLMTNPQIGPDSYTGLLASTIYGSSETTFYVLAVYFGAVGVKNIRHALIVGLLTDCVAMVMAVISCSLVSM